MGLGVRGLDLQRSAPPFEGGAFGIRGTTAGSLLDRAVTDSLTLERAESGLHQLVWATTENVPPKGLQVCTDGLHLRGMAPMLRTLGLAYGFGHVVSDLRKRGSVDRILSVSAVPLDLNRAVPLATLGRAELWLLAFVYRGVGMASDRSVGHEPSGDRGSATTSVTGCALVDCGLRMPLRGRAGHEPACDRRAVNLAHGAEPQMQTGGMCQ